MKLTRTQWLIAAPMAALSLQGFAADKATKPAAKPVATPVVAAAEVNEAKQREAIKELLNVLNFKDVMAASSRNMRDAFPGFAQQGILGDATLNDEQKRKALEVYEKRLPELQKSFEDMMSDPKLLQQMEDLVYRVYMKHYTPEDVQAMVAFYKSPVGQKSIRIMPAVVAETMQGTMEIMMPAAQKQVEKMLAEIKKPQS
jgi:uncharacterized protein